MNLIAHVKVLVLPVGLCFSLIYFSGRSSGSARLGEGDCFHLSSADRRDLGITGKDQVVFIRPHSCQACTHDDMSVLAAISKSKKRFICLLDSDATSAEVSRWEKFGPVKAIRRSSVSIELRKVTLGLYLLPVGSDKACRIEVDAI